MSSEAPHIRHLAGAAGPVRRPPTPGHGAATPLLRSLLAMDTLQARIDLANRISFALCLLPFLYLLWGATVGTLGVNPVETLTATTGTWSLRLLWLTLCNTPLRNFTGWNWLIRLRRIPALFCFFYACLHLLTYLVFEHEFDFVEIVADMAQKPYLIAGGLAFLCLMPLAVTSTDLMMRRLGGKNWRNLHRLTYLAAIAAAGHYLLLVKRDISEPSVYVIILALLFYLRMSKPPSWSQRTK